MTEHVASRTLVKSPPELWAECSDAGSLARHLDQFGDIKITRLEPETAVAWEGERARGTVRIEPAGWGTKVILTAVAVEEKPEEVPVVVSVAEVVEVVEPAVEVPGISRAAATPPPRRRRFRLFRFRRAPAAAEKIAEPEPESPVEPEPEPTPEAEAAPEAEATLEAEARHEAEATHEATVEETAADTVPEMTEAALTAALDSLGQAHHRPYSRA